MNTAIVSDRFKKRLDESIQDFRNGGIGFVCEVFSEAEMKNYLQECTRLWQTQDKHEPNNLRIGIRDSLRGDKVLERLDPVADLSQLFSCLNQDSRMLSIARKALNEPVTVLKEKLIYKWPGTSGYGLHRDEPYFGTSGVPGKEMVSVAIALDPAFRENGAIKFFPSLYHSHTPAPKDEPRDIAMEAIYGIEPLMPVLDRGDVVFFDGIVPHCSGYNQSTDCRRIYTVTYVPSRYTHCRERYYARRMEEQERERSGYYSGKFYFE